MRKRDRGEKVAEEARPRTSGYESRRKSKGGRERERVTGPRVGPL